MQKPHQHNERGMVLLVVLLIVALLVTILVEFAFSSLVDLRLAETYRDTTRAYYLARGGVTVGRTILQEDGNGYDGLDELWAQGIEGYPVADGTVSIRITDQRGRINLNSLVREQVNPDSVIKPRFISLLRLLNIENPERLTDALIDWIDSDNDSSSDDAENAYYRSLQEPYNCKNGPLDNLEELTLVRGFSHDHLRILRPHITVHGSEDINEKLKVNINTASVEVLQSLAEDVDTATAEMIVAARASKSFTSLDQLKELIGLGIFSAISSYTAFNSSHYQIETTAFVNDGRRSIHAYVVKNGDIKYKRVL